MILLLFLAIVLPGYTDMVIYIDVAHFIPADSQFGVEIKGNKWISFPDSNAIGGKAFGE